ncbi:MAG: beta-lactamase family protein [Desulfobacterales bacterium]|nr:beta-lactamase family protein [Desulfobacterales bacterium]
MTNFFSNKMSDIPSDLNSVTTCSELDEVDPMSVGMTKKEVASIWSAVENVYKTGMHPAISFCLRRNDKIVIKRAIGHAKGNGPDEPKNADKVLVTPETPICLFSASKSVTAMLVQLLVEKNKIQLDDPVSKYIPEFASHGKKDITILQLISHRAGIPYIPYNVPKEIVFYFDDAIKMICDRKPDHKIWPQAYHAVTGAHILGEIMQRVTGMDLRDFLNEYIKKPLGFKYFNYGIAKEEISKVAINYFTGLPVTFPVSQFAQHALGAKWEDIIEVSNDPRFFNTIVPAGNIMSTADEICLFFQILLNNGEFNGIRIFNPSTVERAVKTSNKMIIDGTIKIPIKFSAGMVMGAKLFSLYGLDTEEAYGHLGFSNIICWADPKRNISVAFLNTGKPLFGPHLVPIARLLNTISYLCPKK